MVVEPFGLAAASGRPDSGSIGWIFCMECIQVVRIGGFFTNPFEKYAIVKLDHFPNFRGEQINQFLEPPPRYNLYIDRKFDAL